MYTEYKRKLHGDESNLILKFGPKYRLTTQVILFNTCTLKMQTMDIFCNTISMWIIKKTINPDILTHCPPDQKRTPNDLNSPCSHTENAYDVGRRCLFAILFHIGVHFLILQHTGAKCSFDMLMKNKTINLLRNDANLFITSICKFRPCMWCYVV